MIDALTRTLSGLPAWQVTLVVLALSLAGALAVEFVLVRTARRLVARTETDFDDIVIQELRLPLVVTVGLAGVSLLASTSGLVESTLVTRAQLEAFFGNPSLSVIIVAWAWAANQLVNRIVDRVKERGHRYDFAPVFSNVWTLLVVVGAAGGLLTVWGIDITPLLGAAGIAGIAIGFAAKDTVANFFGGIALYFDDTYKIGDYIVLDSGDAGTVVSVGIRSTTIRTRDEIEVTVPNSMLNAARIANESAPQRRRRVRIPVGVAYGTDIDAFEDLVVEVAEAESLVLDSPKPRMRFRSFGDSALQYELLCWVNSPTRRARATHELNRAIYKRLAEAGIEIPFPRQDVTLYDGSDDPTGDPSVPGASTGPVESTTPGKSTAPADRTVAGESAETTDPSGPDRRTDPTTRGA